MFSMVFSLSMIFLGYFSGWGHQKDFKCPGNVNSEKLDKVREL